MKHPIITTIKSLSISDLTDLVTRYSTRSQILAHLGYDDSGKSYTRLANHARRLGVDLPAKRLCNQVLEPTNELLKIQAIEGLTHEDFIGWLRRCLSRAGIIRELGLPVCSRTHTQLVARAQHLGFYLFDLHAKNEVQQKATSFAAVTHQQPQEVPSTRKAETMKTDWQRLKTLDAREFKGIVNKCTSKAGVLRLLGYEPSSMAYRHLDTRAAQLRAIFEFMPPTKCMPLDMPELSTEPRTLEKDCEYFARQEMIDGFETEIETLSDEIKARVAGIKQRRKVQAALREMQ